MSMEPSTTTKVLDFLALVLLLAVIILYFSGLGR